MGLSLPSTIVSDPGCQKNWEAVQRADITALQAKADATQALQATLAVTVDATATTVASHSDRLSRLGGSKHVSSTTAQGPGAVGADVVYTSATLSLNPGTWLVYAQATVSSSVADGKQLALWNGTAQVANSAGAVEGAAAAGAEALLTTTAIVTLASTTVLSLLVKRNGGSALTIGFSGGALTGEQRISAVQLI